MNSVNSMEMLRLQQLKMLMAELVPALIDEMRHLHPRAKIGVADQNALMGVADRVPKEWLDGTMDLEKKGKA